MGKKLTTETFIEKAREVHGDRYDYSRVNYINSTTPVKIVCLEHGEFEQRPAKHLSGQNCPKCSKRYKRTTEEFIKEASILHSNKYNKGVPSVEEHQNLLQKNLYKKLKKFMEMNTIILKLII